MLNFRNKIIKPNIRQPNIRQPNDIHKYDFIDLETKENIEKNIKETKNFINEHLLPIINSTGEKLEGNIFMLHETTTYTNAFFDKQVNFILASSKQNVNNVLEIGFNAGFSALLMLISNPNLKITCVDICSHKYTLLCFNKMKEIFGDRINILCGSSVDVLPRLIGNQYDMIHIDGCHLVNIAEIDIKNSLKLCKSGTILIMDDTDNIELLKVWLKYSFSYKLISFYRGNFVDTKFHNIKVYP
jgi:predicted O-methyltransferase YrrM